MTTVICAECGFDESRWTENDVVRTLAHADDLIGYVLEGADAVFVAEATVHSIPFADNPLASVHDVMHRLHDLAESRRGVDAFDPMVGRIESLQASGGGVPKRSVPVAEIGPGGVVGDTQGNRNHHGRPWQAICLYGHERIGELRREGHPIVAGSVGENLTISGIDWSRLRGGLTIEIGDVRLRTSGPAAPCHKIADAFCDRHWNRIDHVEHPGWARWYASVLIGGVVSPGDTVTIRA